MSSAGLRPDGRGSAQGAAPSPHGRGRARTADLSRVKRDEREEEQPPEQGRLCDCFDLQDVVVAAGKRLENRLLRISRRLGTSAQSNTAINS